MTNRLKGLNLTDCLKNYGQSFISFYRGNDQSHPQGGEKCNKAKWLFEEGKKTEVKGKGERERYTHLNAEFQRIARRDKKAFHMNNAKK